MPNIIEWLADRDADFRFLSDSEREAPMHFGLIWSYFEGKHLDNHSSARTLDEWIRAQISAGRVFADAFSEWVQYIRNRYYAGNDFTTRFNDLRLRTHDKPDLVRAVISGANTDPADQLVALFIVIYRFRNNFFHGPKWQYGLKGQVENFEMATRVIISAIEMAEAQHPGPNVATQG